jgi:hypothetical protein
MNITPQYETKTTATTGYFYLFIKTKIGRLLLPLAASSGVRVSGLTKNVQNVINNFFQVF